MANKQKKNIALHLGTHERLSKFAAQLRINDGGKFVSMSEAVDRLLDRWEQFDRIKVIPFSPDMELSDFVKTVVRSAVDDIAEANETQPVIIKQSDGALYLEKMMAHNHNAYLTPQKSEAMVFDSRDQATAFLQKCGHEASNWIIELV